MLDGAQNALLGYLYQFLVVSSLRVWADAEETCSSSDHPIRTLLIEGRLKSEMFNQDGVIIPDAGAGSECAAIQIKHSGAGNAINLQAFTELLYGFDQSRLQALKEAQTDVGSFWVVTNRPRDPDVENIWAKKDVADFTHRLRQRGGRRGEPKWLKALLGRYRSKSEAYDAWCKVLARLQPVVSLRLEVGEERLRAHLRRYGVLADEVDVAINKLIGRLVSLTAEGTRVALTEKFLNRHLIGAEDVRPATFDAEGGIAAVARERIAHQLRGCGVASPVRRGLMTLLKEQVAQHPVTVVYGGGGCGKSVLTLQYLLDAESVCLSTHASEASEHYLARQLRRLRSKAQHHELPDDALDTAIERLAMANPSATSVLLVGIDAVDELRQQDRGEVHELIRRWASGQLAGAGAKLVVSYRPDQVGERGLQLALANLFGDSLNRDQVGVVFVGDFSDEEVVHAARELDGVAGRQLLGATIFTSAGSAVFGAQGNAVRPEVVESLRHPVVWGAYMALDSKERETALKSLPSGNVCLAAKLVDRFLAKCVTRVNHGWEIGRLEEALRQVARIAKQPPFDQQNIWVDGCAGLLGRMPATMLYREALTYGLITEDGVRRWRWRHPFLAPYLQEDQS